MGTSKEDDIKTKLLDSLAKEPPMVLSTAYVYAKNYVEYGEDITKAWTTAVQQASILEYVRQKAWVEAYDSFKADYENRLKADMVDILETLLSGIKERTFLVTNPFNTYEDIAVISVGLLEKTFQEKINALRGTNE